MRRLFLLFRLGNDRYALAADAVVRVLPLQPLKHLPGAPDWVAGVLVHRGAPVPVIDLGRLAVGQPSRHLTSTRIVLVAHRHRGQGAERTLGLMLEGVTETGHRNPADFVPCGLDSPQARYLGPVLDEPEGMLQWVDVDALLSDEARALLFPESVCGGGRMQLTTKPRFGDLLKQRIGLDAASIGDAAIARAVRLRSTACSAADDDHYWALLQSSPAEVQQLIEAVVVPETWFNRYPESLAALVDVVRERLSRSAKVRILSLPCSTGEEPYSIVMALLDAGIPADRFAVDAVDVSEKVIAFAQCAVYGANSFRGDVAGLRERYFTSSPAGEVLARRVADRVALRAGNLFDPQLLAGTPPYDVIFCRNLLIYFDASTQERALSVLTRATQPTGALFVGPAEASLLTRHGLRAMAPHAFGFHIERAPVAPRALPVEGPAAVARCRPEPVPAPRASVRVRPWTPPSAPVATLQPDLEGLDALRRLADHGPATEALAACERWLATQAPIAQVYCLQGVLLDSLGQPRQAQAAYRKALYLDPSHAESLVHLAALLEMQGDLEGARRLQARSARQERRHA